MNHVLFPYKALLAFHILSDWTITVVTFVIREPLVVMARVYK